MWGVVFSPALSVLAGFAAITGAIGLGYFPGKHVQKKTLLKTLQNASTHHSVEKLRDR